MCKKCALWDIPDLAALRAAVFTLLPKTSEGCMNPLAGRGSICCAMTLHISEYYVPIILQTLFCISFLNDDSCLKTNNNYSGFAEEKEE